MGDKISGNEISFGSLRLTVAPTVYEPAEDSFLLATYSSSLSGKILEIGCGSGIVSLSAARANPKNNVLGIDISPAAVECANENAKANGIENCKFICSDLFGGVKGKFDQILFNPPYLPTTREERLENDMENRAYDGGKTGLETFERFIKEVPAHLNEDGSVAVIATSLENGIEKTLALLNSSFGNPQILASESFFFEKIALIVATKRAHPEKR
jgi:release factor glutamine methyltransferase